MTRRGMMLAGAALLSGGAVGIPAADEPLAVRLGYAPTDKLLILHADDLGMSHSANAASLKAMTEGVVSSASVMVPCPWFPEMARWARERPELDLGLHLTLTSEWNVYRWRPVAPPDRVPGLLDPDGFMWRDVENVVKHARPEEVETEIRAQIARARHFGMNPTHVDSHMGTLFANPRFFEVYTRVAREEKVLPMLMEPSPETLASARRAGVEYGPLAAKLRGAGFVLLNRLSTGLQGNTLEARREEFRSFLRGLKPGVTELIVHLASDDEEIRHITNNWRNRYNELLLFTEPASRDLLKAEGVRTIGYRPLARLWEQTRRPAA